MTMWPRARRPGEAPKPIAAIPTVYGGIRFRSRTEADWAMTFDWLGWHWQYEPGGVLVDGMAYLPDFRIPGQRVWAEVKGPHNERLVKAVRMHEAAGRGERAVDDLVVVLRPAGPGDVAEWHSVTGSYDVRITRCGACGQWCFTRPLIDRWRCRHCGGELIPEVSYASATTLRNITRDFSRHDPGADWIKEWFGDFGRLPFQRVPRPFAR